MREGWSEVLRRLKEWEQKKQEKVGEKSEEKNDECAPKSDIVKANELLKYVNKEPQLTGHLWFKSTVLP